MFLLIDERKLFRSLIKQSRIRCIIKGDSLYASIKLAASILAKTYRDDYMRQLHEQYPHYEWFSNKGYGTKKHREAIGTIRLMQIPSQKF